MSGAGPRPDASRCTPRRRARSSDDEPRRTHRGGRGRRGHGDGGAPRRRRDGRARGHVHLGGSLVRVPARPGDGEPVLAGARPGRAHALRPVRHRGDGGRAAREPAHRCRPAVSGSRRMSRGAARQRARRAVRRALCGLVHAGAGHRGHRQGPPGQPGRPPPVRDLRAGGAAGQRDLGTGTGPAGRRRRSRAAPTGPTRSAPGARDASPTSHGTGAPSGPPCARRTSASARTGVMSTWPARRR